jgi:hypothetical protein
MARLRDRLARISPISAVDVKILSLATCAISSIAIRDSAPVGLLRQPL